MVTLFLDVWKVKQIILKTLVYDCWHVLFNFFQNFLSTPNLTQVQKWRFDIGNNEYMFPRNFFQKILISWYLCLHCWKSRGWGRICESFACVWTWFCKLGKRPSNSKALGQLPLYETRTLHNYQKTILKYFALPHYCAREKPSWSVRSLSFMISLHYTRAERFYYKSYTKKLVLLLCILMFSYLSFFLL